MIWNLSNCEISRAERIGRIKIGRKLIRGGCLILRRQGRDRDDWLSRRHGRRKTRMRRRCTRRRWHVPKTRRPSKSNLPSSKRCLLLLLLLLLNAAKRLGGRRTHRAESRRRASTKRTKNTTTNTTTRCRRYNPFVRFPSSSRWYHLMLNLPLQPGRFHRPLVHRIKHLFQLRFRHRFQHRPIVLFQPRVLFKRIKHLPVITRSRSRRSTDPSEFFHGRVPAQEIVLRRSGAVTRERPKRKFDAEIVS